MRARTCFASSVCCTDEFGEMSADAQALYYHFGFYADNDGAIDGIRGITRGAGFDMGTVDELTAAGLLIWVNEIPFIADWWVNNNMDKANYRNGGHSEELGMLEQTPNRRYVLSGCYQSDVSLVSVANKNKRNGKHIQADGSKTNQTEQVIKETQSKRTHVLQCPHCGQGNPAAVEGRKLHAYCTHCKVDYWNED